jgi:hypothetical protein
MTNATFSKPLLTGAALLLSAAYQLTLYHEASQAKPDAFPTAATIQYVPPIISAVSFLAYSSNCERKYLIIGRVFTILGSITCLFIVYLMFVAIESIMVDFDTSSYGLLTLLPFGYLMLLAAISLAKKQTT